MYRLTVGGNAFATFGYLASLRLISFRPPLLGFGHGRLSSWRVSGQGRSMHSVLVAPQAQFYRSGPSWRRPSPAALKTMEAYLCT